MRVEARGGGTKFEVVTPTPAAAMAGCGGLMAARPASRVRMILEIDYAATYAYAAPVSLSVHEVRLFPRLEGGLRLRHQTFSCGEQGSVRYRRDAFDNVVASCFFPGQVTELPISLALEVERHEWNPFDFLLESRALTLPIGYSAAEQELLGPFLAVGSTAPLPPPLAPIPGRPTVETLVELNRWIHAKIAYERRDEGPPLPVAETLERRRGCCRDVAMVLLESLRQSGVAARLAAGFVWEGDVAPGDRRAEAAMHAWVEAYLPGAGWTGFDPTNGVLTDHHFLPVAIGLTPTDIAPVNGTYFHSQPVMSRLATNITVSKR